jgi:hypothetical protein
MDVDESEDDDPDADLFDYRSHDSEDDDDDDNDDDDDDSSQSAAAAASSSSSSSSAAAASAEDSGGGNSDSDDDPIVDVTSAMPAAVEPLDDDVLSSAGVCQTMKDVKTLRARHPDEHFLFSKVKSRRRRRRNIDARVIKNAIDIETVKGRVAVNKAFKHADLLAATLDVYASHAEADHKADISKKRKVVAVADDEVMVSVKRTTKKMKLPGFDDIKAVEQHSYGLATVHAKQDELQQQVGGNLSVEARHQRALGRSTDVYLLQQLKEDRPGLKRTQRRLAATEADDLAHTTKCRSLARARREGRLGSDSLVKKVTELLDGYMEPPRVHRKKNSKGKASKGNKSTRKKSQGNKSKRKISSNDDDDDDDSSDDSDYADDDDANE